MKKIIVLLFCKMLICSEDVKKPVNHKIKPVNHAIWLNTGLVVSLLWTDKLLTSGEHASDSLRKIEAAIEASRQEFLKREFLKKAAKKAREELIALSSMPQSPIVSDQRTDSTRSQAFTPSPTPASPSNFAERGCFGVPKTGCFGFSKLESDN
jgi:hypothetical protein